MSVSAGTNSPVFRSLTIFDSGDSYSVLQSLRETYPYELFEVMSEWHLDELGERESISVWIWTDSESRFVHQSSTLLREFFLPLFHVKTRSVLVFPFSKSTFTPQKLKPENQSLLDLEDIGVLVSQCTVEVSSDDITYLPNRIPLTPIENILASALSDQGIDAVPQVRLGPYVADFTVTGGVHTWVIEADGAGFHDPAYDQARDTYLKSASVRDVIRFTGSEIFNHPDSCARKVADLIHDSSRKSSTLIRDEQMDESQSQAVNSTARATRVLAPAGSGKTRVLLNRIGHLVGIGVSPSRILALAFNRKAAEQLQAGLQTMGIPISSSLLGSGKNGVVCRTFNSFGYAYQRDIAGINFVTEPNEQFWRSQMEESLSESGVRLASMPIARGSRPLDQFLDANSKVRAGLVPSHTVEVELEMYGENDNKIVPFQPVYDQFTKQQLAHRRLSFDDQIYIAVADMLRVPENRARIQNAFEHVLVDEYQDLNGAQHALVDIVSRPHRNLFVVGDDDQLIYGWRFAKTDGILGFPNRMPKEPLSKTFTLSTNYRSSVKVVEDSSRLIANNSQRESKNIRPATNAPPGNVEYVMSPIADTRFNAINSFLLKQHDQHSVKWHETAVLCRYKAQWPVIAMALDSAGIPRIPLPKYRLFTHPASRLFRAYLAMVLELDQAPAEPLSYILSRPNRYVSNLDVQRVRSAVDPWSTILSMGRQNRALESMCSIARNLHFRLVSSSAKPDQVIPTIIQEFGLDSYWKDELRSSPIEQTDDASPTDVLVAIQVLMTEQPSLQRFVEYWDHLTQEEAKRLEAETSDDQPEDEDLRDEVMIATIHAAKGREYKATVLFDYSPDLDGASIAEREEERRVLYVGATRAMNDLLVTVDGMNPVHPYIKELIAPSKQNERNELVGRLSRLEKQIESNDMTVALARERLKNIRSGDEREELVEKTAVLPAKISAARQRLSDLEHKMSWENRAKVISIIRGQQGKLKSESERLSAEIPQLESDLKSAREQLTLLDHNPDALLEQLESSIASSDQVRTENLGEKRRLLQRINQLRILAT